MEAFQMWQEAVLNSFGQVSQSLVLFIPSLVGAIIVFVIGIFVAFWAKKIIEEILKAVKFEDLSTQSGFTNYLRRAELHITATELIGDIIKWLFIFVFFIAAVDILGLSVVSRVLTGVLAYIPDVIAAALIFGAGFIIANLVGKIVRGAIATVDSDIAKSVGRLSRWVVVVVAFFAAIGQLNIAPELTNTFFQGLTWTFVLVFGLSIGLGAKDFVAKMLDDWYKKIHSEK